MAAEVSPGPRQQAREAERAERAREYEEALRADQQAEP